jgi:aspartate/methionine/tyrosine aminotransferase
VTFSARTPADLAPNRLSTAVARLARGERTILDLTLSNPTRAGLPYPLDLLSPLADSRGLGYAPDPFGLDAAREAVALDYHRRGRSVSPHAIALTSSTSEAYSLLFKLLCNPGDQVLVPRPSYPLFEHLTRLDAVAAVPYALEYHGRWSIDLDAVARAFTPATRAVLVVNPNNPTGSFVSVSELDQLAALARSHGAAIIADEVFADYELTPGAAQGAGWLTDRADVLGFSLGGLSKSVGLPQAKLSWIAMSGPSTLAADARARLEFVCDTYLSVSTPVQVATPALLDRGASVRTAIQQRVTGNLRTLTTRVAAIPACDVLQVDGGWYAVVRVPSIVPEEELVLTLLTDDGVLVHPGYFFDFPSESFLVVSLLTAERSFADGVARILERVGRWGRR